MIPMAARCAVAHARSSVFFAFHQTSGGKTAMLKKNVGGFDRLIRIALGLIVIGLAISGQVGSWGLWVGAIVLATGLFSFCGAYTLVGFSSCPIEQSRASKS
jgi:Protein of unknown function (DUF2892)